MTRAVAAWSGDQRALDALQRSRVLGQRLIVVEGVCAADHTVVDVWMTTEVGRVHFRGAR